MKTLKEAIQRIKTNNQWYNKSYSGYFTGIYEQVLAITGEGKNNPYALTYGLFFQNYHEKDHMDWFWDATEMKQKRELIIERIKKDKDFVLEVLKVGTENHKKFKQYTDEIDSLDLLKLDNAQIFSVFEKLPALLISISQWSYAVDAFLSDGEEDWLVLLIKNYLGQKATSEVIETLTQPTFSSFVNNAEILFLKICQALQQKDDKKAKEYSKEYEKKYFWIRSNYKNYKRVTSNEILKEAKAWTENSKKDVEARILHEEQRTEENIKKKKELYRNLKVQEELQAILSFSEVFTHLQDNRKERVLRMNTIFYEFIAETQKRFSIKDPLGFYMTHDELFDFYKGKKVDLKIIQDRYEQGVLGVFYDGKIDLLSAKEYKNQNIEAHFFKDIGEVREIKGNTAYKGIVKGIVRVARNVKDISKFKQGEILVANQTTPEYVPAMKKAAAIVTDQGGITCHAAIVARELKTPCVIGTKIATQALKDGMKVEVDANTGIVKILSKA